MRRILIIAVLTMTALSLAQGQSPGQRKKQSSARKGQAARPTQTAETNARSQSGRAFTPEEKAQLTARLFAGPQMSRRVREERYRVLSIAVAADDKSITIARSERRLAQVVLFNYTLGKATRLLVDASNAEVLAEAPIGGRPQSSEEEIQEAIKIVRQDRELSRLLQDRSVLQGGFIVDGPRGTPPQHRFLQLQILTSDRLRLQRLIIVDLTAGTIASSSTTY